MIRVAFASAVLLAAIGCADRPDRTPTSDPVDYVDPEASASAPNGPGTRRIEMH